MRISIRYFFLFGFAIIISCNSGDKTPDSGENDSIRVKNPLIVLNQKIAQNNDNDLLFIQRADYYLSIDKADSALRDILIAIDIDHSNPNHYITLSDAYLAKGNPDKCLEALDKAIALDNENKEALLKRAQLYLIMRNYTNAYSTLDELINIDRINPMAYFTRAIIRIEEGDTTKAIKNLQIAIDQKDDFFDAQLQLGILLAGRKDPLAVSYLQNAIDIMPHTITPYYQLGLFFQENGRTQSAIQTYNNILDIEPGYYPAIYNIGYINLVYEEDPATAIDYFSQVVQLAPDYVEAWYNRGYCYELSGQRSLAREDYEQALKIRNNYPRAIEGLNRLDANWD